MNNCTGRISMVSGGQTRVHSVYPPLWCGSVTARSKSSQTNKHSQPSVYVTGGGSRSAGHIHQREAELMEPKCSVITRKRLDNHSCWSGICTGQGKSIVVHWTAARQNNPEGVSHSTPDVNQYIVNTRIRALVRVVITKYWDSDCSIKVVFTRSHVKSEWVSEWVSGSILA